MCLRQPPLPAYEWVIALRRMTLFVQLSRGILLVYELGIFLLIVALLFGVDASSRGSVVAYIVVSMLYALPMCVLGALECYIVVGKVLAVTDADLEHFRTTTSDCLWSCLSCIQPFGQQHQCKPQEGEEEGGQSLEMTTNPLAVTTPLNEAVPVGITNIYVDKNVENDADTQYTSNPLHSNSV